MILASGSAADRYTFTDLPTHLGYRQAFGKTVSDPRLVVGETTGVFVVAGQSNAANTVDTPYTPTNATKVDQINIYDGGTYRAVDPLLGPTLGGSGSTGNIFSRMADKLINDDVYDRIILVPVAVGSTSVAEWETTAAFYSRLIVAGRRAAAVGLTITAYLWMQGESDKVAGTSQGAYQTSLSNLIAIPRAAGFLAPWLIGKCSYTSGTTGSAVRAAQAAVVNGVDIFAGADTDTLTGTATNRQADDVHFKAAGADAAATLWKTAIAAVF